MPQPIVPVYVRLPVPLYEAVRAQANGASISATIVRILEATLKKKASRRSQNPSQLPQNPLDRL